jgi:hypothetical protein
MIKHQSRNAEAYVENKWIEQEVIEEKKKKRKSYLLILQKAF